MALSMLMLVTAPLPALAAGELNVLSTPTVLRPFDKGTWTLDLTGDYVTPLNDQPERFAGGTVGIGFAPRDGVITGIDLRADALIDPGDADCFTGGADLKARLHLFDVRDVQFFFDATAGVIESSVSVPREAGSNFSFRTSLGVGAYVPIANDWLLVGGIRFEHISNGGIQRPNPGYNGAQFFVGVTIPL